MPVGQSMTIVTICLWEGLVLREGQNPGLTHCPPNGRKPSAEHQPAKVTKALSPSGEFSSALSAELDFLHRPGLPPRSPRDPTWGSLSGIRAPNKYQSGFKPMRTAQGSALELLQQ